MVERTARARRLTIIVLVTALVLISAGSLFIMNESLFGESVASGSTPGEWIKMDDTPKAGGYGEAVVGTGNNIYIVRCLYASSNPGFWCYNSSIDNWDSMSTSELPTGAFRNGAALTWDYGNYIYALLGARYSDSNRRLFYRYNTSDNNWMQMADTPHAQGAGDAITWSEYDNQIYALLGSKEHGTGFARYNPSYNSWEELTFNPNWTFTDDGCSLVWTGGGYLYALRGEWHETIPNGDFARYHITTDTWGDMSSIPESDGVGDGASLLWIGNWLSEFTGYIFALGGGEVDEDPGYNFYSYNISYNSWEQLESIPCPIGYYVGNRLGFANEHIYYWQGSPTTWSCGGNAFYRYQFIIDTIPPDTIITSGPSGTIDYNDVTFTWTGSDDITSPEDLVYSYILEGYDTSWSIWASTTSKTYNDLANDDYTFKVKAKDQAGNEDLTPATRSFTVETEEEDTIPPTTTITSGPSGTIDYNDISFEWTGTDDTTPTANLVYSFKLEGHDPSWSDWASSTSKSYNDLPDGSYTFKVKTKDEAGNIGMPAMRSFTVEVIVPPSNRPPIANFTWTPEFPTDLEIVNFFDNSTDLDGYDDIVNWTWNFGDENISYGKNVGHQYIDNGTYTITLRVKDNDGATDTKSQDITVRNVKPTADFTYTPKSPVNINTTINFSDDSTDPDGYIINWTWKIWYLNCTEIFYGNNISYTCEEETNYIVNLTVRDNDGDMDSSQVEIEVEKEEEEEGGIPGFEILFLIAAITIVLLWKRNRN